MRTVAAYFVDGPWDGQLHCLSDEREMILVREIAPLIPVMDLSAIPDPCGPQETVHEYRLERWSHGPTIYQHVH